MLHGGLLFSPAGELSGGVPSPPRLCVCPRKAYNSPGVKQKGPAARLCLSARFLPPGAAKPWARKICLAPKIYLAPQTARSGISVSFLGTESHPQLRVHVGKSSRNSRQPFATRIRLAWRIGRRDSADGSNTIPGVARAGTQHHSTVLCVADRIVAANLHAFTRSSQFFTSACVRTPALLLRGRLSVPNSRR